jgi:hypothetical protein
MFKNVRITLLELKSKDQPDSSLTELTDYTSHSYEFMTRLKAMAAVEKIYTGADSSHVQGSKARNEALTKNLIDAILNPNTRLGNPAAKTLKKLMEKAEFKESAVAYYRATPWKDWEKEKLKSIFDEKAK